MKNTPAHFNVNTFGIPEVKELLINLYQKKTKKQTPDINIFKESPTHKFLQFWFNHAFMGTVTHADAAYTDHECQRILTIDEAIQELSGAPKEVAVKLNKNHTAIVTESGVKVGCQEFPLDVIVELSKARSEVLGSEFPTPSTKVRRLKRRLNNTLNIILGWLFTWKGNILAAMM
jgi:hypothetical protein